MSHSPPPIPPRSTREASILHHWPTMTQLGRRITVFCPRTYACLSTQNAVPDHPTLNHGIVSPTNFPLSLSLLLSLYFIFHSSLSLAFLSVEQVIDKWIVNTRAQTLSRLVESLVAGEYSRGCVLYLFISINFNPES